MTAELLNSHIMRHFETTPFFQCEECGTKLFHSLHFHKEQQAILRDLRPQLGREFHSRMRQMLDVFFNATK